MTRTPPCFDIKSVWPRALLAAWLAPMMLLAPGCDRLPGLGEKTSTPPGAPSAPPTGGAQPTTASPAAAPAPPPAPKTPQQVIDEFLATPAQQRRDEHLAELAALPEGLDKITQLDLGGSAVSDAGLVHLPKFKEVEALNLSGTRVSNQGLAGIGELSKLKSLGLDGLQGVDETGCDPIAKCELLEELSLNHSVVADGLFVRLKDLDGLRVLRVSNGKNLTGHEFTKAVADGAFPELRELHATDSQFVFYGLLQLNKLKNLEVLDVSYKDMNDALINGFKDCRNLRVLRMANSKITSAALVPVGKLRNLEELNVGGCPAIADAGLGALKSLKKLKLLVLDGTGCTPAGVQELKEKHLKETRIRFGGQEL